MLRQHQTNLTDYPGMIVSGPMLAGEHMGTLYAYRDKTPSISAGTVLFDSAEITGNVVIGEGPLISAGVKIIGDSTGLSASARGCRSWRTVLRLLPDDELIIDDDAVIGPGAMITAAASAAAASSNPARSCATAAWRGRVGGPRRCLRQAARPVRFRSIVDGFPAGLVSTLTGPPPIPGWALPRDALATLRRVQRR